MGIRFDASSIALSSYAGWGINGTSILFIPDDPFSDPDEASNGGSPRAATASASVYLAQNSSSFVGEAAGGGSNASVPVPSSEKFSSSSSWKLIVGLTLGVVGGAAVIASVVAAFLLHKRHRNRFRREDGSESSTKPSHDSEMRKEGGHHFLEDALVAPGFSLRTAPDPEGATLNIAAASKAELTRLAHPDASEPLTSLLSKAPTAETVVSHPRASACELHINISIHPGKVVLPMIY